MVVPTSLLALSFFSSFAVATSLPFKYSQNLLVHESRDFLPTGVSFIGPAASHTPLKLRIALSQTNPDAIVTALLNVSDPASADYGNHLSKSEVEALVAPSSASVSAVNAWLQEHCLSATAISPAGDWLQLEVNVSKANSLLAADFSTFSLPSSDAKAVRTLSYSIPAALKGHIDLIHPTTAFPEAIKTIGLSKRAIHEPVLPRAAVASSKCGSGTTPACVQSLYNIPTTPATNSSNKLAVTGRFGNNAHYNWLQTFLKKYRPDMKSTTNFTVVGVDDGNNDQDAPSVSEGELDIQYTVGLATNVPVQYVMVGVNWTDDGLNGYLDEINYLLSLEHPPQVLSTSYGYAETSMSYALTDKLCKAYAQLGARGVSVLFASGDNGVGCQDSNTTLFQPTFPSNCPYVTSVGGTAGSGPETAWAGSSGGFSNYYAAPSYQASAVDGYLTAHTSSANYNATVGKYNPVGRGFPDVAAKADDYRVQETSIASIYGTSASTPVFASIVALINDRLSVKGKPPLGFLNPWLYSTGKSAFTDITKGNNSIECNGETAGFEAVEGWDPVTGLGTPDFNKLLKTVGL
ncbi:family S53 protease-like protein [Dichomitus squalens]|uniref:tripeptidyl-peptidase II n=1 Tax=Dichomitus squalens TaxID=114155 RepID=A0A4Q9PK25_9APHY|nr:family S53 protease-like protein [Dichomitus squalens]